MDSNDPGPTFEILTDESHRNFTISEEIWDGNLKACIALTITCDDVLDNHFN